MEINDNEKKVLAQILTNLGPLELVNRMLTNIPVLKANNAQSVADLIIGLGVMATEIQTKIDGLEAAKQAETNKLFVQKAIVLSLKAKLEG